MKILINNDIIDFTLDLEKNCLEVVEGLSSWLDGQDYFISELFLDGKEYYINKSEDLKKISVESVKELSIIVLNKNQMILDNLETVSSYFKLYQRALNENNKEVMIDLGDQYNSIKKNLPTLLLMNEYVFDSTLNELMNNSGVLSGSPEIKEEGNLLKEWHHIQTLISGRVGELTTPEKEGTKTVLTLKKLTPKLEEVSTLFQSGKDKEALDIIIVLSELLSKSLRILSALTEKGLSFNLPQGFMDELNGILRELGDAIESGDTILTGDLAEYEIIPKIEILDEIFNSVSQGDALC